MVILLLLLACFSYLIVWLELCRVLVCTRSSCQLKS
jgi:hypothetical protein